MAEENGPSINELLLDPEGHNLEAFEKALLTSIKLFRLWWTGLETPCAPIPSSEEIKKLISASEQEFRSSPLALPYAKLDPCIKALFQNMRFNKNNLTNIHPTPLLPSVVASVFAMLQNPNNLSPTTAPATTTMEAECVSHLAELVGFHPKNIQTESGGNLVSCGSLSNLTALMVAREKAQGKTSEAVREYSRASKPPAEPRGVVLTTASAHYSIQRAVRILGLGDHNLVKIPVASKDEIIEFEKSGTPMKLKPSRDDYAEAIEKIQKPTNRVGSVGQSIISAVPTLGTVTTGTIEPVQPLIDLRKEFGFHIHVDAAIGGLALSLPEIAKKASGVEYADSLTIDPHKLGYLHYPCSLIIFRNKSDLDTIAISVPYLEHTTSTIEGSRPGASVAGLWMALKTLGVAGYGRIIGKCIELTKYLSKCLAEQGFQVLHEVDLNTVCFSLFAEGISRRKLNRLTSELHAKVVADGRLLLGKVEDISGVMVSDKPWLQDSEKVRLTAIKIWIMNPSTSLTDIESLVSELLKKRNEIS